MDTTNTTVYGAAWTLHLSTFSGIVGGASHYFVTLAGRTEDVTIEARVDAELSRNLSTRDYEYKVGWTSERFPTREDALAAGVLVFQFMAGDHDVLLDKYDDPGQVLAGAADLVAEGTAITGDDAWWNWKGRFQKHIHPTRYGYKAPPSPRSKHEVVVARVNGIWTVEEAS